MASSRERRSISELAELCGAAPGERMITVAYDSKIFTQQEYGGVSRYFCELIPRVAAASSFCARVIVPLHSNVHLRATSVPVHGFYLKRPERCTLRRVPGAVNRVLTPLVCAAIKPTLLHETYYERFYCGRSLPTVTTVHDMMHEIFPQLFAPDDPTSARKRASVDRADLVLCNSECTRRDLVEVFGIPKSKTRVTYLASSVDKRSVADTATPRGLSHKSYLLYVGSRGGYKNFSALLQAYRGLGALREQLRVVAFGGGSFTEAERREISAAGLTSTEVEHRQGTDTVLYALYRNAAALVYPSLYEGFGIPPLEAMALRCPVVCSARGSLAEVVGDAALLFEPERPDELAEKLRELVESDECRERLIERGLARAGEFSWERCAEQTVAAYRELV
jgi:glycosyltransferase involved in cell wall biosynthesis